jgi:SAM-dependent methyltransferase
VAHRGDANEHNRQAFSTPETVGDYARQTGLSAAERHLVERFVPAGSAVLDLGVGTGRTTPELSRSAARYVGVDVSEAMVARARELHPDADLRVGDAADLGEFGDGEFDAVVFSWNGLDYLHPASRRHACLDEVSRVLRAGGHFVFSVHDPRCLLRPPARPLTPRSAAIAAYQTARRVAARALTSAAWRGDGYVVDAVRGGLVTHMAVPAKVVADTEPHGFRHAVTVGADHPAKSGRWSTGWWYYAFERRATAS